MLHNQLSRGFIKVLLFDGLWTQLQHLNLFFFFFNIRDDKKTVLSYNRVLFLMCLLELKTTRTVHKHTVLKLY